MPPLARLLFLLLALPLAHAQSRIDCSALPSRILKQQVHYCVMLPDGYAAGVARHPARQYPVLYFLHGLGDNEQTLIKSGGWNLVEDLRQQHKIGDFLIVAPEGRDTFYINSADGRVRYSDFFLTEFMPYIEHKYSIQRSRRTRGISGVSMGGYGALRFAFAHPELFGSVSAESAALFVWQGAEGARLQKQLGQVLGGVFGNPVNRVHWKENDPIALARKNQARIRGMLIYLNCGRNDDYGFETGAEALHKELDAERVPHEFHLYPGNHGAAYFLAHLDELMKFHSRAFDATPAQTLRP